MAVRERIALIFLIVFIFFVIKYSHCLPKNYTHRPSLDDKKLKKHVNLHSITSPRTKPMLKPNSRNRISLIKNNVNLYEKFNFPEIQYPMASTPNTPLYFHEFGKDSHSKNTHIHPGGGGGTPKKRRNKKLRSKTPVKIAENFKGAEFSSAPSYRDVGLFPDVEYPLNTKDVWQPNYWNCPQTLFTSSPMNISSKTSTIHSTKASLNTKIKKKPNVTNKTNHSKPPVPQKNSPHHTHTRKVINSNQPDSVNDPVQSDLPKKRSHDISKLISEDSDYFDNFYAATPMPYLSQKEDKTKSTLRSRIISNIAKKAVSLIKNIVHSEKNNFTTENYNFASINEDDILEEILCLPPSKFNDYSLVNSETFYATTPRTSFDVYSTLSPYNVTQPWINHFTAFTEQPEQYNNSQESDISVSKLNTTDVIENNSYIDEHKIDNTILSNINEIINSETDTTTLSPRGCVYDDNKLIIDKNTSILGNHNHSDVKLLDKANIISYNDTESKITLTVKVDKNAYNISDSSFKIDDDYTTDVYPESSENGFVLSTASPLHMSEDPSWSNAEIIDPYKSLSYPDELEEYYMTVT